jgi:hypothetical protein
MKGSIAASPLGAGAKSEAIKAAQSGLDVKRRGVLRLVSSREARIEQREQREKSRVRCREIDHAGRAQITSPGNALADPGEHD